MSSETTVVKGAGAGTITNKTWENDFHDLCKIHLYR